MKLLAQIVRTGPITYDVFLPGNEARIGSLVLREDGWLASRELDGITQVLPSVMDALDWIEFDRRRRALASSITELLEALTPKNQLALYRVCQCSCPRPHDRTTWAAGCVEHTGSRS